MKKLMSILAMVLAINFIVVAGGVGVLVKQHRLDREKITAIKEILFPKPIVEAPTTEPVAATTQPLDRLNELLTKASGRSASEQVEFIRQSFDAQTVLIDRRQRELEDLQRQVDIAKSRLLQDRQSFSTQQKDLDAQKQEANRLANDKGFQESLTLYNTMPPKQVKTIFLGLDDATVMNYFTAMEPKTAAKIIKEYKTPEEIDRVQKILEKMRLAQASARN